MYDENLSILCKISKKEKTIEAFSLKTLKLNIELRNGNFTEVSRID